MGAQPPDPKPGTNDDVRHLWQDLGSTAYVAAFLIAFLTFVGLEILANALGPDINGGAVFVGSLFLALAAGTAVLTVILAVRRAGLSEPPSPPRSDGKAEV